MTVLQRYQQAHERWFKQAYPSAYSSGHYCQPIKPDTRKANGLTRFIINFLQYEGWRATRISSTGRLIDGLQRQQSGVVLTTKKWIPGQTRRGTADISATIKGRAVMLEIKVGRDRASEYQLAEQARERAAGGCYEFIHSPEEFFVIYDKLVS